MAFWLFSLLAFSCGPAQANDGKDALWVVGKTVTAPLHGQPKDYWIAAGLLSGVALTSTLDRTLHTEARKPSGSWVTTVNDIGHTYQGPLVTFGTAGALYGYGYLADKPVIRRVGLEIVEAYAVSGAGTQLVKHLVGRNRPYENHGPYRFSGPGLDNGHLSFPSGDVTVASSFSAVIAAEARSWPVTAIVYGLTALTVFQRMNRNQHWLSDTMGAAVWGTAVGLGVVHFHRQRSMLPPAVSLSAGPGRLQVLWAF